MMGVWGSCGLRRHRPMGGEAVAEAARGARNGVSAAAAHDVRVEEWRLPPRAADVRGWVASSHA